jgi:hypothetical protein
MICQPHASAIPGPNIDTRTELNTVFKGVNIGEAMLGTSSSIAQNFVNVGPALVGTLP